MTRSCFVLILFAFQAKGVFGETDEETATAGQPFILKSGVTKQHHDTVKWYFNDTLIALINGRPDTSCLYEGEGGRFRDRLMVDYETGSLNITHIRPGHAGRYEAQIYRKDSTGNTQSLGRTPTCDSTKIITERSDIYKTIKSFRLTVSDSGPSPAVPDSVPSPAVPDSGLSPAAIAGICVALVLVAAAVVGLMIRLHKSSRNGLCSKLGMRTNKFMGVCDDKRGDFTTEEKKPMSSGEV